MCIRKTLDNIMCVCEDSTACIKRFYKFMKGLSFRSKADIDLQLKSSKKLHPLFRCGFNCDKEVKILPVVYVTLGILLVMSMLCSSKNCKD